jgi:thiamine biosynthesis lipoprotein
MVRPQFSALVCAVLSTLALAQDPVRFHKDHVLGTSLDLAVLATPAQAQAFLDAAMAEVGRLEGILSAWSPKTQVAALNRGETVANAAPELLDVLELAESWRSRTHGAFDVRIGQAIAVWREAATKKQLPADTAIDAALNSMRAAAVSIDRAKATATPQGGVQLAIDGIAKGYILDKALAAARKACPDVTAALLDIGGDEAAFGKGPGGKPWRLGIANPQQPADNAKLLLAIGLADRCSATSGGYARGFDIDGTHYSHILDPGTGRPASGVLQATVVAKDAATADALATALCVLEPAEALEIVNGIKDIDCLIVDKGGKRHQSRSFARWVLDEGNATAEAGGFPDGYSLEITLTLPKITARYKRPYTAVWIEDTKGKLVCTLALWGRNRRWVSELTNWWSAIDSATDQVDAVGRASRGAGEYTLTWGGRDDAGKPVGAGDYTLVVEVSREHGGHTIARQKLHCGTSAQNWTIAGNKEMEGCAIRYTKGSSGK